LAARVQAREREMYTRVLQLFAKGRVKVDGRKVKIT
jgi:folate-dependent phosphoribosylglycinamide formyltransferase PurN